MKRVESNNPIQATDFVSLFNNVPLALWEVDMSEVSEFIDKLRFNGVKDFRKYFDEHVEDVTLCASLVKIINVNQATLDLYKAKSQNEFIKWSNKIFTEDSLRSFQDGLVAFATGQILFETENSCLDLAGNFLAVKITRLMLDSHDKPWSRVLICVENLTQNKELVKSGLNKDRIYKQLLQTADEGIGITGLDGIFTYVNKKLLDLTGYDSKEMIGMSIFDMFDKDKHDELREHIKRRSIGIGEKYEIEGLRKDGTKGWVLISANPIYDDMDQIVGTLGMVTDIDERIKVENELKKKSAKLEKSEKLYSMLTESSDNIIAVSDKNCRIEYINKKGADLFKKSADDLIGLTVDDLYDKKNASFIRKQINKAVKSRREVKYLANSKYDGTDRWINVCIIPDVDSDGKVNSIFYTSNDVTTIMEEKSFSEFLNVINATLGKSDSPKGMIADLVTILGKRLEFDRAILLERQECCVWQLKYFFDEENPLAGSVFSDKELPCAAIAEKSLTPKPVEDTHEGERVRKKIMMELGFRSIIMIPIIVRAKLIGMIGLGRRESTYEYPSVELDFYNKLTSSVALSLSNLVGCDDDIEL